MAISRSLMNRQLRASGGIMDVTPRENFGLGSSLKKFVRKIIPNEVAEIATKAAPFVAPFNPALAGVMSGIGTFDQTGSIGSGLKAGAMNYGGGQLARYAGGAGFQGNPFGDGGAFTGGLQGFKGGFSSPIGTETGLGKFFSNQGTQSVQGVGDNTILPKPKPTNLLSDTATETITGSPNQMTITESIQKILSPNTTMTEKGGEALNLLKRGTKAAFTKSDGKGGTMIDKAAIMGAVAFAGSYAEALALAGDAGVEITEEAYDEARKAEKKEEYAGYLENFFAGKKDGGRIGYEGGANELIMEKLTEDIMPDTSTEDMIMIMTDDGPKMIKRSDYEAMPGMFRDTTTSLYGDAARGRPVPEFANGGRIGYEQGANEYITKRERQNPMAGLGLLGGIDPTIDESGQNILIVMTENGPQAMTESEFNEQMGVNNGTGPIVIDMMNFGDEKKPRIIDLGKDMKKDGGRINRRFGSPEEGEGDGLMEMLSVEVDAGGDDQEDMKMAGITFSSAEKSYLFRKLGGAGGSDRSFTMPQLYRVLGNPDKYAADAAVLKEIAIMGLGKKDGGRIGLKDGTDKSMLEKFLNSKLVQEGRYGLSEFLMNDPILFGTPDKFKDGKNNKRGTFKRDSSEYDKLSPEKQAYIEAFLNSDEDNLFLKPGKISFPINERMREHNKNYDEQQTISEYFPDSKINMKFANYENRAQGGRIGFKNGTGASNRVAQLILERDYLLSKDEDVSYIDLELESLGYKMKAEGGIMEAKVPTGQMRENNAGVAERDYRQTGGFVPVGIKERADDVPAMLSKNEFVMTADAVRGIGNGSVEEGSKKLYNTMKQAEQVGKA